MISIGVSHDSELLPHSRVPGSIPYPRVSVAIQLLNNGNELDTSAATSFLSGAAAKRESLLQQREISALQGKARRSLGKAIKALLQSEFMKVFALNKDDVLHLQNSLQNTKSENPAGAIKETVAFLNREIMSRFDDDGWNPVAMATHTQKRKHIPPLSEHVVAILEANSRRGFQKIVRYMKQAINRTADDPCPEVMALENAKIIGGVALLYIAEWDGAFHSVPIENSGTWTEVPLLSA